MGGVYRRLDTNLKREVAIKVLPASVAAICGADGPLPARGGSARRAQSSNIAQIYGLEKRMATTALVMELVDGPTLAVRVAEGSIPVDEALVIAKQIALALEAAHERGIVHRDLKPANVSYPRKAP